MNKIFFLFVSTLFYCGAIAQQSKSILLYSADPLPQKRLLKTQPFSPGPTNNHTSQKTTAGVSHSDWYDLWDEMYDTVSSSPHSYLYQWDIYPDSNLHDATGFYPPYNVFTHGLGMSFDPTDSAYYYHAVNPAYRVSAPFPHTLSYQLDSFWVPGRYMRNDTTAGITDSLIVEFLVTQNGGTPPDSGCYALISTTPAAMYYPCTKDRTPRFATPRYFRANDECIDPVLTTTTHQRFALPLTAAYAYMYRNLKIGLPTPITVVPGKYLASYVYFKSQVAYPLGTQVTYANYYMLYAGEPTGINNWYPQSAHNTSIGYPGSHQDGLIATNQIRYSDAGFTFNGHNILLPSYAYANTGANLSPGFDVPCMAFHIKWSTPDPTLAVENPQSENATLTAFPNPAGNVLNFCFEQSIKSDLKISLLNIYGQTVLSKNISIQNEKNVVFDVSTMQVGLYTYLIESTDIRKTGLIRITH